MNTADVARDLDLLRQAVGDRKLTYLGFSYGSYLGNTYANLFPHNVRALVIDGVLDPRLWSSGWQIQLRPRRHPAGVRRVPPAVRRGRRRTARSPRPEAPLHAGRRLPRALREEPLVFPDGFVYTYDFLITDADERDVRARGVGWSGGSGGALRLPRRRRARRPGRGGEGGRGAP